MCSSVKPSSHNRNKPVEISVAQVRIIEDRPREVRLAEVGAHENRPSQVAPTQRNGPVHSVELCVVDGLRDHSRASESLFRAALSPGRLKVLDALILNEPYTTVSLAASAACPFDNSCLMGGCGKRAVVSFDQKGEAVLSGAWVLSANFIPPSPVS